MRQMISHQWIEGTGAEISAYASKHASERFRLVVLDNQERRKIFDKAKWDESLAIIEAFRGKLASLPDDAFTTDSLYD